MIDAIAKKAGFEPQIYSMGLDALIPAIMTHKDHVQKIRGTKDLEGKTLCVEIGSSGGLFSATIPGVKLRTFNSATEAFMEIDQRG
ncbi:MAG: hypothetical protein IKK40_06885 [Bacteroidales bacterium]|nr:hypothetical protein [Bacteroidales bacterium]